MTASPAPETITFRAEIRQLLDILIHSLYTEREIFLRELISNASDALHRLQFEMLTNPDVHDPQAELAIRLTADKAARTLTLSDTGIGMTRDELVENLGTIAHSGAAAFLKSLQAGQKAADVIGRFGVGFYAVFMVAEEVRVTSRSHRPEAGAWTWVCRGDDTFQLEPAEKAGRGTDIVIRLKEEAAEFADDWRLEQVVHRHSDFVSFPIQLGDKVVNRQTPLWRQPRSAITDEAANEFYKDLTLDFEAPRLRVALNTDSPVQIHALLFVPARAERGTFSLRKQPGLKLYSRKVLIQEYCPDLLPGYLRFVQGVVESEDLPLNVSRETVQSNKVMERIQNALTHKVIDGLKELAAREPDAYRAFWQAYGPFLKEGLAADPGAGERLMPLLRFASSRSADGLVSLADYAGRMKAEQREIYYLLADSLEAAARSPHLDYFNQQQIEVLFLTDPIDSFMLGGLPAYEGSALKNAADAEVALPAEAGQPAPAEAGAPAELAALIERFQAQLGERVSQVRASDRLVDNPLRLAAPAGQPGHEMDRVRRLLEKDFSVPVRVVELNPRHALIQGLAARLAADSADPLVGQAIEQLYENGLLLEGLHPNPAEMVGRIHSLLQAAVQPR